MRLLASGGLASSTYGGQRLSTPHVCKHAYPVGEVRTLINLGIIGYGYWGPNLVRNFAETVGANVAAVADLDSAKLAIVQRRFPGVKTTTEFRDLLSDPMVDAI